MTGVQVRRDSLPWSRPLLKPDRHGHSTPLSRPTCAPRATSSRVDSLFESRREVRGGDPPRIPPTARSPPGCSRATLGFDIQLSGVRHPRLVRPDRPSARVTSRSRTRAASACFLSRDVADTRLTDERLLDRRCARADDFPGFSSCPRLASCSPNPPRGVLSSTHAAPETRVICERFANRDPDHASPRRGTGREIRRTTRADALTDFDAVDEPLTPVCSSNRRK